MVPSVSINASAGLPVVANTEHVGVYNATTAEGGRNAFGVYNHGPIITRFAGRFYISWYNAPKDESTLKRSVFATSVDGRRWSKPAVLFPPFTQQPTPDAGEENGPWTILGVSPSCPSGRLYTQSGTEDAGEHHEGIVSVARRVFNATTLGPV